MANLQIDSERNVIIDRHSTVTDTYTAIMGETIIADATDNGAFTITLPTYHTYMDRRTRITIKKIDAVATVKVDGAGAHTIDGAADYDLTAQWDTITIISTGPTTWNIISVI